MSVAFQQKLKSKIKPNIFGIVLAYFVYFGRKALQWLHNERNGVSNHRRVQAPIKENTKAPRHWPLWGESTGDRWFPSQRASNAENVSIWWRHHGLRIWLGANLFICYCMITYGDEYNFCITSLCHGISTHGTKWPIFSRHFQHIYIYIYIYICTPSKSLITSQRIKGNENRSLSHHHQPDVFLVSSPD